MKEQIKLIKRKTSKAFRFHDALHSFVFRCTFVSRCPIYSILPGYSISLACSGLVLAVCAMSFPR